MLPIVTQVLGPHEYGVIALANAYTGFGSALAAMGGGYVMTNRFVAEAPDQCEDVVSTVSILGFGAVVIYGVLLYALWPVLPETYQISMPCLGLALVTMVFGQPWIVAADVLTLSGDARNFALILVIQTIVAAVTLLVGLFVFGLDVSALFLAQAAGSVVSLAGAVWVLRGYFRLRLDTVVLRELRSVGLISGLGNLVEALQTAVERSMLSRYAGITQLGIYTHSQQYRVIASMPGKAIARTVWPVTLSEARDLSSDFSKTRTAWDVAYIGFTFCGILFATLGDRLIGLLTNGKFTDAYVIATFWMIFLLVSNSGKPQTGTLYALGGGPTYARLVMMSGAIGLVALVALIPLFGIWGAVAAVVLQQIFLRVGIQTKANAIRRVPFQDRWVYIGTAYVLGVFFIRRYFDGALETSLAIFAAACGLLLLISWRVLWAAMQRILFGRLR